MKPTADHEIIAMRYGRTLLPEMTISSFTHEGKVLFQAIMTMVGRVTPLLLHTANPVSLLHFFTHATRDDDGVSCAVGLTARLNECPTFY